MTEILVDPVASGVRATPANDQAADRRPKNIVLLSDGTGNSGGKGHGTNVWRLFNAVDLHGHAQDPSLARQLVFYDDGVGTDDRKLWKLLGGAFGFGLSRNIRELYAFLIKNYRPGDHVYIFGFSRGAFTARSLAGLICSCGIADPRRELSVAQERTLLADGSRLRLLGHLRHRVLLRDRPTAMTHTERLEALVRAAFGRYRREHFKNRPLWPRWMRRVLQGLSRRLLPGFDAYGAADARAAFQNDYSFRHEPKIRCVGVWDTVGALGAPSAEIRWLLDRVFRTDFHSRDLHPEVEHGFHALAIDDARLTFHPVMWDETERDGGPKRPPGSIEQVWFGGAHSNVGGGYPKQGMAHVSLLWMMRKAAALGLRFYPDALDAVARQANVTDKLFDPRAGLGAYYRYRPRDIDALARTYCNGRTKIHASVFHRIACGVQDYAPFNLPARFEVVDEAGAQTGDAWRERVREVIAGSGLAQLRPRIERMVAIRRALYYAMWACTALLLLGATSSAFVAASALFWFWQLPIPQAVPPVEFGERTLALANWLSPLSVRTWTQPAAELVARYPLHVPLLTVALLLLYWRRNRLDARMAAPFIEFWSRLRLQLTDDLDAAPAAAERPAEIDKAS